MDTTRTLRLKVAGAAGASAPPTWGQRTIWEWHGFVDTPQGTFTNANLFDLPPGLAVDAVVEALQRVLTRQDALRTVFTVRSGRIVSQEVQGAGELVVEVVEAAPGQAREVGEAAAARLNQQPWTCREWPLRLTLVDSSGEVPFLVMSHNRLLLDVQSLDFVVQDVLAHVARVDDQVAPRWQPVDEARFENGPEGRALSARAAQDWRSAMASGPATMYDYPLPQPEDQRFLMAQIESRALSLAVHALRRRWRITGGPLVLAAASLVLARYTGHDDVVMLMFVGNRAHPDRRRMLGTLLAGGALQVSVAGHGFDETARQAARAVRTANQAGLYDPDDVAAVRAAVERQRGAHLDLSLFFNDMQTGQDAPDADPAATDAELAELAAGGLRAAEIGWGGWDEVWQARVTRQDIRFMLTTQHSTNMPLMLFCDTQYFSRETMRQMVTGIERLLVTAAGAGVTDPTALAGVSGVARVERGPDWVRCADAGWVNLPETEALWRQVTGTPRCALVPDEDGLVGYVVGEGPGPDRLHETFLRAIGNRSDMRTPVRYRRVAASPEPGQDWAGTTLLVEGDGRP